MKKKLKCIMMIDDDEPTNFLNKLVLEDANCAEQIIAIQSADEALGMLKPGPDEKNLEPDLIILDINMPAMNGWEFIEAYKQLFSPPKDGARRSKTPVIVMMSTSPRPDDIAQAQKIPEISDYKIKPLSTALLQEILDTHFS